MQEIVKKIRTQLYIPLLKFESTYSSNRGEWDVHKMRNKSVPCIAASPRVVVHVIGIAFRLTLNPVIVFFELAEFVYTKRL